MKTKHQKVVAETRGQVEALAQERLVGARQELEVHKMTFIDVIFVRCLVFDLSVSSIGTQCPFTSNTLTWFVGVCCNGHIWLTGFNRACLLSFSSPGRVPNPDLDSILIILQERIRQELEQQVDKKVAKRVEKELKGLTEKIRCVRLSM